MPFPLHAAPPAMILRAPFGVTRVVIGPGLLHEAGPWIAQALPDARRATVVTDARVARLPAFPALTRSLRRAGFQAVRTIVVPPGETTKRPAIVATLWRRLAQERHERAEPVVSLGGGVVGDLAGFAAATYMRGVPLVQVPTTLVAQADAAVGGKTGVNLPHGKNLVGAFHAARLVLIDPTLTATLPQRHYRGGLAEIVKCAVIRDADLFRTLERSAKALRRRDPVALEAALRAALRVKIALVEQDPRETGRARALLNYGHTIGHALEAAAGYRGRHHGEAVAIGMQAEAFLAQRAGLARDVAGRQGELLAALGLPVTAPEIAPAALATHLVHDKKVRAGRMRFALPVRIGHARFPVTPPPSCVRAAIHHVARG